MAWGGGVRERKNATGDKTGQADQQGALGVRVEWRMRCN